MAFASPSTAGLGAAAGLAGGAAVDCAVAAGSYESTVSWRTAPTVAARSRHCDSGHADGEAEGVGEGGGVEGDGFAEQATNRHAARAENTAGVAFMGSRYPASLVGPAAARQRALPWLKDAHEGRTPRVRAPRTVRESVSTRAEPQAARRGSTSGRGPAATLTKRDPSQRTGPDSRGWWWVSAPPREVPARVGDGGAAARSDAQTDGHPTGVPPEQTGASAALTTPARTRPHHRRNQCGET